MKNQKLLIISILIAAVLISGSIFYSAFTNRQKTSGTQKDPLQVILKAVGLDSKKLSDCVSSGKYKNLIDQWTVDAQTAKIKGTPTFLVNSAVLIGEQSSSTFANVIEKELKSNSTSTIAGQNISGDSFLGDKNAPVTIIEYSSYGCIYCINFHKTTFPQLKKDYIDTGKVKFVARILTGPLTQGGISLTEAALCSIDQGKYWEFSDYVFNNIEKLTASQ